MAHVIDSQELPEAVWQDVLGYLRVHYAQLVRGWFATLRPGQLAGGELQVFAANTPQKKYLDQHCLPAFVAAAQAATGHLVTVRFQAIADDEVMPENLTGGLSGESLPLIEEYIFDHFIVGPCNRLAHATCVAVSESPGRAYNPLFVHGSVGLGKTHLLQAICHAVLARQRQARVLYLSCETFINDFMEAVELGQLHTFRYRYRHADMLVLDDIQFLADRERSQEEFFHTFNTLYQAQKQIVLAADSPPEQIPSLQDRLVSRFSSGMVARIDQPCYETRIAIVRKKAKIRQIDLPEQVIQFIASTVTSNTRELEGALLKIVGLSQAYRQPVSMQIAEEALGGRAGGRGGRRVTIQNILEEVSKEFGARAADIQGKRRTKSIAQPRQVCMYLARELTDHSLEEIGGYFGGRDHSTVLHACKTITQQRQEDARLRQMLDLLTSGLQRSGK
jgi:chromosomal replication initiator protein